MIYSLKAGIINLDDVREKVETKKKNDILIKHKYAIFKGKDGRWRTSLPDNTKKSERRLIAKSTLEKVENEIIAYYTKDEDETYIKKNIHTLESLFPMWLEFKYSQTDASSYIRRINNDWNKYYKNNPIVQKPLEDLTYLILNKWAHELVRNNKMTKKQYYNCSTIMRQCLEYACEPEIGIYQVSPFARVRIKSNLFARPDKPQSNEQVYLDTEQTIICNACKEKYQKREWCMSPLIVMLNFQLGLRIGELCALKWSDISGNYIHIQRMESTRYSLGQNATLSSSGYEIVDYVKSVAGNRQVYLNENARNILAEIKQMSTKFAYYDDDFIYIKTRSNKRATSRTFTKYLTDLCCYAGVSQKSNHKIRKTYISSLFQENVNINTIREQAGHCDERTTLNNYCFDTNTDEVKESLLEHAKNPNIAI